MAVVFYYKDNKPVTGALSLLRQGLTTCGTSVLSIACPSELGYFFGNHFSVTDINDPNLVLLEKMGAIVEEPNRAVARCMVEKRGNDMIAEAVANMKAEGVFDEGIIRNTLNSFSEYPPIEEDTLEVLLDSDPDDYIPK